MNLDNFFRKKWKTVLGIFLITIGLDALINNQIVYSNLPPQLAETFQYYYKEPATKTLPSSLMTLINWPFYTTMIIGAMFMVWDFGLFRRRKEVDGEMQ